MFVSHVTFAFLFNLFKKKAFTLNANYFKNSNF